MAISLPGGKVTGRLDSTRNNRGLPESGLLGVTANDVGLVSQEFESPTLCFSLSSSGDRAADFYSEGPGFESSERDSSL